MFKELSCFRLTVSQIIHCVTITVQYPFPRSSPVNGGFSNEGARQQTNCADRQLGSYDKVVYYYKRYFIKCLGLFLTVLKWGVSTSGSFLKRNPSTPVGRLQPGARPEDY